MGESGNPLRHLWVDQNRSRGNPSGETLPEKKKVSGGPFLISRKESSASPHSALNLVEYKENAPVGTELSHPLEKPRRWKEDPSLSLDRLDDDRRKLVVQGRLKGALVAELQEGEFPQERLQTLSVLPRGGCREGPQGLAVVPPPKREEPPLSRGQDGELQGGFHRFGSAVCPQDLIIGQGAPLPQLPGDPLPEGRAEGSVECRQPESLLGESRQDLPVSVTEEGYAVAACPVEVALPRRGEESTTLAMAEGDSPIGVEP
ncbi:MAG: hypothetical protein BWY86_01027 [Candidatus Aminicenantes bacterium ADurb.Bin508]|nr:MAG: hypothetical protein BWY86_01027 [Candidatus Aminicenantes bacterium ADurb.Bin508]